MTTNYNIDVHLCFHDQLGCNNIIFFISKKTRFLKNANMTWFSQCAGLRLHVCLFFFLNRKTLKKILIYISRLASGQKYTRSRRHNVLLLKTIPETKTRPSRNCLEQKIHTPAIVAQFCCHITAHDFASAKYSVLLKYNSTTYCNSRGMS